MKIIEKMNNQFKTILSIIFITVGLTARANGWTELGGFVMTGLVIHPSGRRLSASDPTT
jgi:hypothetical protein